MTVSDPYLVWMANKQWGDHGFDRRMIGAMGRHARILWVDPPVSPTTPARRRFGAARTAWPVLTELSDRVTRLTPMALPGRTRFGIRLTTEPLLHAQVRWALRRTGIVPFAVVATHFQGVLGKWGSGVIRALHGADDYVAGAELLGLSASQLRAQERRAVIKADVVTALSPLLAAATERSTATASWPWPTIGQASSKRYAAWRVNQAGRARPAPDRRTWSRRGHAGAGRSPPGTRGPAARMTLPRPSGSRPASRDRPRRAGRPRYPPARPARRPAGPAPSPGGSGNAGSSTWSGLAKDTDRGHPRPARTAPGSYRAQSRPAARRNSKARGPPRTRTGAGTKIACYREIPQHRRPCPPFRCTKLVHPATPGPCRHSRLRGIRMPTSRSATGSGDAGRDRRWRPARS